MLMENANKHIKDVFIFMLRQYFKNSKNYYRKLPSQISREHYEKALFYDSEPEELRNFPAAIISAETGNMVTAGLADFCSEVRDPRTNELLALRYQGFYEMSVQIDIACRNPLDREVFSDLIAKALRFDLRRFIQNEGVIIKSASYSGEQTLDYNSDKIYISQLKFDTFSSWIDDRNLLNPDEFDIKMGMNMKANNEQTGTKQFMDSQKN